MVAGDVPFFLGCGAYRHHVPASVDHIIQRGEYLTSYTPYQPEIAQGTPQTRPIMRNRFCCNLFAPNRPPAPGSLGTEGAFTGVRVAPSGCGTSTKRRLHVR